jgi:beta-lactamase superfamily II metal-dependent hydrolase
MVFVAGLALRGSGMNGDSNQSFPLILEAEEASYTDLTPLGDANASNNQFLRMGDSGSVEWTFSMDEAGWYKIQIGYKNSGGDSENNLIQNGVVWRAGFGWSSGWTVHQKLIALSEGENTIGIAANYGHIDIDYLSIDTVSVLPRIVPTQNNFYTKSPRDIVVKVNAYGRGVSGVTAGGSALEYTLSPYPFEEDAWHVNISGASLAALPEGDQAVSIDFDSGESSLMNLNVITDTTPHLLTIIAPHVSHGNAVLIILPTGKTMLIDCGDSEWRDRVVIPVLQDNGINKLDYFILTHYHADHDGGDGGATIKTLFDVDRFFDYQDFDAGDRLDLESTQIKILNAHSGGTDENQNSLSFKMEYNGFIYIHGADIYGSNQRSIMSRFPADVRGHIYSANHHFHGSADAEYMRAMDPCLVFVQAEQAIYARSTFTQTFQLQTAEWLKDNNKRFIEGLPTLEVGTVVIRASSADDWTYETYGDTETPVIPYLPQNMHLYENQDSPPEFLTQPPESIFTHLTGASIELLTDKTAYLRYSTDDQPYDDMPNAFDVGQGLLYHQTVLPGVHGQRIRYYIRAMDRYGNETPEAVTVTLETDTLATPLYWHETDYRDTDWKTGTAPLGYGEGTYQTEVAPVRTLYMRTDFTLPDSVEAMGVLLKGHDGIAAYINGVEIARLNVPDETAYETYAVDEPAVPISNVIVLTGEQLQTLRKEGNVIALEVHQADVSNPSISADARVFNSSGIYLDLGDSWKYFDAGEDPPVLTYKDLTSVSDEAHAYAIPGYVELKTNYPNPFNPVTSIEYKLPVESAVKLYIFNVLGQPVDKLVDSRQKAGTYKKTWDADRFESGIYVCRLETENAEGYTAKSIKMVLIK